MENVFRPQLPSEEKGSEQTGNRQDLLNTLTGWDMESVGREAGVALDNLHNSSQELELVGRNPEGKGEKKKYG